jgi:predicted secreted protein
MKIILAALTLGLIHTQTLTTVLDLRGAQLTTVPSVDIHMGNSLEVLLTENPSTGHSWSVDELLLTRVTLVSTQYTPSSPNGLTGAGGSRSFVFKSKSVGA